MKQLLESYCDTLIAVKERLSKIPDKINNMPNSEYQLLSSAKADLEYIIEWLSTSRRPGNRRGVERLAYYQRERLMDPNDDQFLIYTARANKISCRKLSEVELAKLTDLMAVLTEREKEIYTMVKGYGYSLNYIAEIYGCSKSTIKEHYKRAKNKLDIAINKELQITMFL